jgi:hypothetical protein
MYFNQPVGGKHLNSAAHGRQAHTQFLRQIFYDKTLARLKDVLDDGFAKSFINLIHSPLPADLS